MLIGFDPKPQFTTSAVAITTTTITNATTTTTTVATTIAATTFTTTVNLYTNESLFLASQVFSELYKGQLTVPTRPSLTISSHNNKTITEFMCCAKRN